MEYVTAECKQRWLLSTLGWRYVERCARRASYLIRQLRNAERVTAYTRCHITVALDNKWQLVDRWSVGNIYCVAGSG